MQQWRHFSSCWFLLPHTLLLAFYVSWSVVAAQSNPSFYGTWIQLNVNASTGPAPLGVCDHSAQYDAINHQILVAQGERWDNTAITGIWALQFLPVFESPTWINLTIGNATTKSAPFQRTGVQTSLSADPSLYGDWTSGMQFMEFGGFIFNTNIFLNDTWTTPIQMNYTDNTVPEYNWTDWSDAMTTDGSPMEGLAWGDTAWGNTQQSLLYMYGGTSSTTAKDSPNLYLLNFTQTPLLWQNITDLTSGDIPPGLSGCRLQYDSVHNQLVLMGGYMCTDKYQYDGGGNECFTNNVWLLSLNASTLYNWRLVTAGAMSSQVMGRAWHSTVLVTQPSVQLWVFGGNYVDEEEDYFYFNDVWVFDLDNELWYGPQITGAIPSVTWSQTASLVTSVEDGIAHMVVVGGCTSFNYTSAVYALKLNTRILPTNCYAEGMGIQAIIAGQQSWFLITTRNITNTFSNGSVVWGNTLTWGVGQPFDIFVIGQIGAVTTQIDSAVTEIGNGVYNVSYIAIGGGQYLCNSATQQQSTASSTVSITVRLDHTDIPGSPFYVPVFPSTLVASATTLINATNAVKGKNSTFIIQPNDEYGNAAMGITDSSRFTAVINGGSVPVNFVIDSESTGVVSVSYIAPSLPSYSLSVSMDGVLLSQCPLSVSPSDNLDVSESFQIVVQCLASLALFSLSSGYVALYKYRSHPIFKASSPLFLCLILAGCQITVASVLLPPINTPAGQPHASAYCSSYAWILSFGFTLSVSALIAKTWRIARIFTSKKIKILVITDRSLLLPIGVACLCDMLLNLVWVLVDPLSPVDQVSASNSLVHYLACESQYTTVWYALTFGGKGILLMYGVILASQVRNVPSAFNESKWIGLTIYNIAMCCSILFLTLFLLLDSNSIPPVSVYLTRSLVVTWCVLGTAALLIGAKILNIYGVILESASNTQEDNTHSHTNKLIKSPQQNASGLHSRPSTEAIRKSSVASSPKPRSVSVQPRRISSPAWNNNNSNNNTNTSKLRNSGVVMPVSPLSANHHSGIVLHYSTPQPNTSNTINSLHVASTPAASHHGSNIQQHLSQLRTFLLEIEKQQQQPAEQPTTMSVTAEGSSNSRPRTGTVSDADQYQQWLNGYQVFVTHSIRTICQLMSDYQMLQMLSSHPSMVSLPSATTSISTMTPAVGAIVAAVSKKDLVTDEETEGETGTNEHL